MAKMESTDDLGPRKNLLENYQTFPDPCWAPPAAMVLLYMYQKDLDHVCEVATTGCFFQHNLGTILKIPCHIFLGPKLPVDPISAV